MKKFIVIMLIVSSTISQAFCQWIYDINFDSKYLLEKIFIDTISNPNNCWQIGKPSKASLLAAKSSPNVIATDTLNPYPSNDTSFFTITHIVTISGLSRYASIFGYYYINSDTLTDYGKIELSPDKGKTWIDLINDTIYLKESYWIKPKPVLTGINSKWTRFFIPVYPIGQSFNFKVGDTVLYRFSFFSDSIQTNKGGLIYDDLHFEDFEESINEPSSTFHLCPNPATDALYISSDIILNTEIEVFNPIGECVLRQSISSNTSSIDISTLKTGVYFVIFKNNSGSFQQKFMKL